MNSHICHVITSLAAAGAEQYVVQLSNHLARSGTRVSIIAGEPQTLRDQIDPLVHVEVLEMHPGKTRSVLRYGRSFWRVCQRLSEYFRRERVTVVHTHLAASALPAWIAAKLCGIPVIHSKMYSGNEGSSYERTLFASRLPLWVVNRFLVFTRYAESEVLKHWRVPSGRVVVSSIGVDTARFDNEPAAATRARQKYGLSAADRVILVVARLYPEKDVELAIRAACSLDDPTVTLLIAGDGPSLEQLQRLAEDLQSSTRVRFLGLLKDTTPAYAAADLLLQTSRSPNLGTVVLEGMASGLPVVIAYRDADELKMARDTFDGLELGLIVEANPKAIATAMAALFADPNQLQSLGRQARTFIERRHARQTVYPALADHYAKLESAS